MTPAEVDDLKPSEYAAFWRYREDNIRAENREVRRAQRRR